MHSFSNASLHFQNTKLSSIIFTVESTSNYVTQRLLQFRHEMPIQTRDWGNREQVYNTDHTSV